jgi:hypothetical protein
MQQQCGNNMATMQQQCGNNAAGSCSHMPSHQHAHRLTPRLTLCPSAPPPLPPPLRSSGNMHITVSSEKAGLYDLRMQAPPDGAVYSRRVSLAGASDGPPASDADGDYGYSPGDHGYGGVSDMQTMVGGGGWPAACAAACHNDVSYPTH